MASPIGGRSAGTRRNFGAHAPPEPSQSGSRGTFRYPSGQVAGAMATPFLIIPLPAPRACVPWRTDERLGGSLGHQDEMGIPQKLPELPAWPRRSPFGWASQRAMFR